MTVTIENTAVDTTLNIAELTTGSLTGTGVFDVLLQTLRLHLDREFTSGRITGTAYATVYSQALTSFLGQATAYCLSKAKLALELKQMQEVIELTQLQQTKLIADTRQTDYITDSQLAAEVALKAKQLDLLAYDLTNIKPTELSIAQQEIELKTSQAGLAEYDLTVIKPQELALITQQVATQQYTVQTRMPAEVADITAGTALKVYDLTDIKPNEKAQIEQQTTNLESQQNQIEAETDKVLYETTYVLPENVKVIKNQQDQLIAQTNKVTTDTVVAIKQGHLTDAQTCQVKAQTNQVNAEVSLKLPEEVEVLKRNQTAITAQVTQSGAQTALLAYDLEFVKPAEVSNLTLTGLDIEAGTANKTQSTTNLVAEAINLGKQGELLDSQTNVADKQALSIVAETSKVVYQTENTLPEEVKVLQYNQDQIVAQTTKVAVDTIVASKQGKLVDAQVCEVKAQANQVNATVALKLPEEVEVLKRTQLHTTAQTEQVTYTTTNLLPAQVTNTTAQTASTNAQTDLYEQKKVTELAQTTTTAAAGSVMGVQNALMEQQTENYLRDAEQKAAKIMIETWAVRQNTDGGQAVIANHLGDTYIATAVDALLAGI